MQLLRRFRGKSQMPTPHMATYIYPIGAGGIGAPIDLGRVKSTGSPLLDRFMGIGVDETDMPNTDAGWATAYAAAPTMFRCIEVRSQTLASIPLRVVNAAGDDVSHPLSYALSAANTRLRYITENDLQVYGRAFWSFGRDRAHPDRADLKRLNPATMEVIADADGLRGFKQVINGVTTWTWQPHEMVYISTYNPSDDFGYVSPTQRALRSIGVTLNITAYAEYFFKNGAFPDGILVTERTLTTSDRERILAEWRRQSQGTENAHGTALLDGPAGSRITYQPLSAPIKDLAMPELTEKEERQIAKSYGVPPSLAMIENATNYATAKEERSSLYTETVLPELDMIIDCINQQLVPRFGVPGVMVEADTSEVEALQEDRTEITQRAAQGVGAGYLSLNDARDLENQDPLKHDYFTIGGRLVPRQLLEAGDYDALRELGILGQPAQTPALPFGGFPTASLPTRVDRTEPPIIIDNPPQKAIVEVVVHATDDRQARQVTQTVVADTMLKDLERWRKKIASKGVTIPFEPNYLPDSITAFLRADVCAWDGITDRDQWVETAFNRATKAVHALVKQDEGTATPDEFEAYWRGIDALFEDVGTTFEDQFTTLRQKLAQALRAGGAPFDLDGFLRAQQDVMTDALVGTAEKPGVITRMVLAGAARGNDLVRGNTKQADLTVDWQLVNEAALAWAKEYAGAEIAGINNTTLAIFREKIAEWIAAGGTLEDLADYIEGLLPQTDIPDGWSPGRIEWATSRSRARLIAQDQTTTAFTEGNYQRWEQLGYNEVQFRTQNDSDVDDEICRPLHGVIGTIRGGFVHPRTGKVYRIPAHPGCRCFPRPITGKV